MRRGLLRMIAGLMMALSTMASAQDFAIHPQFESAGHFHDGIAPVLLRGKWGFINVAGQWVVQPQFDSVIAGADRRFGVQRNGLWGYIDTSGALVIPHRYAKAKRFSEGMAAVSRDGRTYTQIYTDGRDKLSGFGFRTLFTARDGLAIAESDQGWTAIRANNTWPERPIFLTRGETVVGHFENVKVEELTRFSEQMGFAKIGDRFTLLWYAEYENFNFLSPQMSRDIAQAPSFKAVRRFNDGLAAVSADGQRWGYIDKRGYFVIAPQFEAAREFAQGVAPVRSGGKWGYIDRSGRVVFPPQYDRAYSFSEGFATYRQGDGRGFLQLGAGGSVSVLYPPVFEDVFRFQEGLAPVKMGGFWGYIAAPGVNVVALRPIQRAGQIRTVRP